MGVTLTRFKTVWRFSKRKDPGESFGAVNCGPQLGAGRALGPAAMPPHAKLRIDPLSYGALIVIVVDVAVSLPNGVPGGDLRHHRAG